MGFDADFIWKFPVRKSNTAYVNISTTAGFPRAVATATPVFPESFEFNDVAYAVAVPEPAGRSLPAFGMSGLT
jgi:hypothetical protein